MALRVIPLSLAQANAAVALLHRHHKPVVGHRFSLGAVDETGTLRGAVIVGRPVSRGVAQYTVAEVTRLVTDGVKNGCSFLYSAAARACREMGFEKIQTYILVSEPGTSLVAAGWNFETTVKGRDWNTPSRGGRRTDQSQEDKARWSKKLNPPLPDENDGQLRNVLIAIQRRTT